MTYQHVNTSSAPYSLIEKDGCFFTTSLDIAAWSELSHTELFASIDRLRRETPWLQKSSILVSGNPTHAAEACYLIAIDKVGGLGYLIEGETLGENEAFDGDFGLFSTCGDFEDFLFSWKEDALSNAALLKRNIKHEVKSIREEVEPIYHSEAGRLGWLANILEENANQSSAVYTQEVAEKLRNAEKALCYFLEGLDEVDEMLSQK